MATDRRSKVANYAATAGDRTAGRFSACCRASFRRHFASLDRRSLPRPLRSAAYGRLTVLSRLMDSTFARYYWTLGQFYESRLVHSNSYPRIPWTPAQQPRANSVFTDNGATAREEISGAQVPDGVIYERLLPPGVASPRIRGRKS